MTTTDRSTAVGVFTERAMAEKAIEELRNAGFTEDEVGFIAPQHQRTGAIYSDDPGETINSTLNTTFPAVGAPGTGAPYAAGLGAPSAPMAPLVASQTAYDTQENDEGTGSGAATGAVGGGVLGGIIGAAAALLIPGFGPVIAGGILAATLGGAALGALAGGLVGALTHLGIPEIEANYYQDELNAGKTVITVHAPDRFEDAMTILRANGATDAPAHSSNDALAVSTTTPVYDNNQFVETVVPDYNDQPFHTVPPIYDNDPITDTTLPPTAPIDTTLQTARTAAAVNTTTSDSSISPQGAYTPTMPPIETVSEAEQRSHETYNTLNTAPNEHA